MLALKTPHLSIFRLTSRFWFRQERRVTPQHKQWGGWEAPQEPLTSPAGGDPCSAAGSGAGSARGLLGWG